MTRLTIEQIRAVRDQHSVVEVLARYGVTPPPRWNGASDFMVNCPCPNHDDRTPSCMIHPQTDRYYCFGCGAHGDVLQLVQDVEGIRSLADTVERLDGPITELSPRPVSHEPVEPVDRTSVGRVLDVNQAAWQELTSAGLAATGRRYLAGRGLDVTRLERRAGGPLAGYTPAQPDGLSSRLLAKGFTQDEIVDAGWAVERDDQLRDRFRRRVLLPVRGNDGAVRGVIGRDITGRAERRYVNTPSTVAFNKGSLLYSPLPITSPDCVVVCEGPLDAIAIAISRQDQLGLRAVAACGTALTDRQVSVVAALHAQQVQLCPDGDDAGRAAGERWAAQFTEHGVTTEPIQIAHGHDPVSLLRIGLDLHEPTQGVSRMIDF
jgi:DNA primase